MKILMRDEKLLWKGCPKTFVLFNEIEWFLNAVGIVMIIINMYGIKVLFDFYNISEINKNELVVDIFYICLFCIVPYYQLIGRHQLAYIVRKNITYFITDKRLIESIKIGKNRVFFMNLNEVENIVIQCNSDGTFTVYFKKLDFFNDLYKGTGFDSIGESFSGKILTFFNLGKETELMAILDKIVMERKINVIERSTGKIIKIKKLLHS
jgi:hypothetical protein